MSTTIAIFLYRRVNADVSEKEKRHDDVLISFDHRQNFVFRLKNDSLVVHPCHRHLITVLVFVQFPVESGTYDKANHFPEWG